MLLFIVFCIIAYAVGGELWEICRYGLILGFVWAVVSEIIKKRPAAKARKESRKADREARRARRELEAARKELAAAVASVASAPSADDDEDEDEEDWDEDAEEEDWDETDEDFIRWLTGIAESEPVPEKKEPASENGGPKLRLLRSDE